jgi:chorismate mutase
MDADYKEIKNLRKHIDKIDQEILKNLKERIRITEIIGRIKKSGHSVILDEKRESDILDSLLTTGNKYGIDEKFIISLWRQIIEYSYKVQEECE